VPITQTLAQQVKQAGELQEGALTFMANFYLYEFTVHVHLSHGERGLQPFHQKVYRLCPDVSTGFCGLHSVRGLNERY
jgi:hypothetical protein